MEYLFYQLPINNIFFFVGTFWEYMVYVFKIQIKDLRGMFHFIWVIWEIYRFKGESCHYCNVQNSNKRWNVSCHLRIGLWSMSSLLKIKRVLPSNERFLKPRIIDWRGIHTIKCILWDWIKRFKEKSFILIVIWWYGLKDLAGGASIFEGAKIFQIVRDIWNPDRKLKV